MTRVLSDLHQHAADDAGLVHLDLGVAVGLDGSGPAHARDDAAAGDLLARDFRQAAVHDGI